MSTADEIAKLHELVAKGALNRLRLSQSEKWIAGVCGGIARLTGVESWMFLYFVLWIFAPREEL